MASPMPATAVANSDQSKTSEGAPSFTGTTAFAHINVEAQDDQVDKHGDQTRPVGASLALVVAHFAAVACANDAGGRGLL